MTYLKGKNVNLYVDRGGTYVLAICATNISRRASVSTLSTLTKGGGNSRRYKPTIKEEQITLEGLRTLDTPTSFQSHEFEVGQYYDVRIVYDDLAGNTMTLDGNVLVTGYDDNNGAADFATWSVSMVRNGTWAISYTGGPDVTPPFVVAAKATGPNTVRVTFSEAVVPTAAGWTVFIQDISSTTSVTGVSGSGTVWNLTTSGTMSPGQILYLNYSKPIGNTLDLSANEMETLFNFPIENSISFLLTYVGYLAYMSADPYTNISGSSDPYTYQISGTFISGNPEIFNISTVPPGNWVVMKEPDSEPVKTNWYNTAFNNGPIPDSVFRAPITFGGFRYYVSWNPTAFDTTQTLKFS